MNFEKFCTCSLLFIQTKVGKMLELTNLTNMLNYQYHVQKVKIRPKTKILNMNPQDEIFMSWSHGV